MNAAPADAALLQSVAQHFYEDDYENGPSELVLRLRALADILEQITPEQVRLLNRAFDIVRALNRALDMGCCGILTSQDFADHSAAAAVVPPLLDALARLSNPTTYDSRRTS